MHSNTWMPVYIKKMHWTPAYFEAHDKNLAAQSTHITYALEMIIDTEIWIHSLTTWRSPNSNEKDFFLKSYWRRSHISLVNRQVQTWHFWDSFSIILMFSLAHTFLTQYQSNTISMKSQHNRQSFLALDRLNHILKGCFDYILRHVNEYKPHEWEPLE